jgi:site-specific DNA-methyltransferase (adenine-specific)
LILSALANAKSGKKLTAKTRGSKITEEITADVKLIHADAREFLKSFPDLSVNCLITDPPWGVQYDEHYDMDEKEGLILMEEVLALLYDKLTIGSLCWMFCATKHLITGVLYQMLLKYEYRVYPQIMLWTKPTQAHASHPYRQIKGDYEPIICFSKGEGRDFVKPIFSIQQHPIPNPKLHDAHKPHDLLKLLVEISTNEYDRVIDPFCGCGSTLKACKELGRDSIGIEKLESNYNVARINLGI